jgi:glucan 1,3-beta-glucosidase
MKASSKPSDLLNGGAVFEKSKPLYEDLPASSFISVKSAGAKGDGVTDDTDALQKVLDSATADQVVYFDHGAYVITSTLKVPKDIKITGEVWPMIMAHGSKFQDETNPIPAVQVGQKGYPWRYSHAVECCCHLAGLRWYVGRPHSRWWRRWYWPPE